MTNSLDELLPVVKDRCLHFVSECHNQGIEVKVTGTKRSFEEQDALYSKGRTAPGPKVTNAKGGQSLHNWGVAFDCVPVVNGVTVYDNDELWSKIGHIGASCGLEWGGTWTSFPDKPHFQYTLAHTWEDFLNNNVDLTKFNRMEPEQIAPSHDVPVAAEAALGEVTHDNAVHRVIVNKETGNEYKVTKTTFGEEEVIFSTEELGEVIFSNIGKVGNLLNDAFTVKEV